MQVQVLPEVITVQGSIPLILAFFLFGIFVVFGVRGLSEIPVQPEPELSAPNGEHTMSLNIRTVVFAVVGILLLLFFLKSLVKMAFWFLIVGVIGYFVWKAFFKKAPEEEPKQIGGSKRYDDF